MKRAILIAGGTIGGLGAVLSITPPQFGNSGLGGAAATTTTPTTTATKAASTPAPAATKAATATATKKATATSTKKATATATKAATATATKAAGASGTFAGKTVNTRFGPVQVQITVVNGKITAAKALQTPQNDFRSAEISRQAIPYLVEETLAAQSANIQGVGGASYTSQGWYDSLVSALAKAGM
jgi:uncharacterized protein with FMN-binding domain